MFKKNALILGLFIFVFAVAQAQENRIGIRAGYGMEVSYQRLFGDNMRLELDLGMAIFDLPGFKTGVSTVAVYQWFFPITYDFFWYVGAGGQFAYRGNSSTNRFGKDSWSNWIGGVAPQIGIEYVFDFPLQLSFDWRPTIGFQNERSYLRNYVTGEPAEASSTTKFYKNGLWNFAVGVRYVF